MNYCKPEDLNIVQRARWPLSILLVFIGLLIVSTYPKFIPPTFEGFLFDKQQVFYSYYVYVFYAHLFAAAIALFSAVVQVLSAAHNKMRIHRLVGKVYIAVVLLAAAPSGFVMAFHAIGGRLGVLNFVVLSCLWWVTSFIGWRRVVTGNVSAHRRWMYRSFVLAASAVFLRIYSYIFFGVVDWVTDEAYLMASILSWLPNLILLELYLRAKPALSNS